MTDCRKIFFDTAPLIYLLDKDATWGQVMRETVTHFIEKDIMMVSSVVTCMEYLVHPYRDGNQEKIDAFWELLDACSLNICPITRETAALAAKLRSQYGSLKGMDALQLSISCIENCDVFLTNDKRLCQCKEAHCILIDDFVK